MPDQINTTAGDLPLGGDVQVYALRFEWALNEQWSIVAAKDGYIEVDPDTTLVSQLGFANLGAANSENNADFVTAAVGFRSRINEQVNVGVAYELPLLDDEDSLMKDRVTLDLVWEF